MNNTKDKIANPLNFYDNPVDVDRDEDLTVEEKIKVLKNWLDDIRLRQTAEAENMPAHHQPQYHMGEIEKLLEKYEH